MQKSFFLKWLSLFYLCQEQKGENMRKATFEVIENPLLVNTSGLQALTQSGRPLAIKIGELAGAKVQIGRSVRWNREKVESYLNKISTTD